MDAQAQQIKFREWLTALRRNAGTGGARDLARFRDLSAEEREEFIFLATMFLIMDVEDLTHPGGHGEREESDDDRPN